MSRDPDHLQFQCLSWVSRDPDDVLTRLHGLPVPVTQCLSWVSRDPDDVLTRLHILPVFNWWSRDSDDKIHQLRITCDLQAVNKI